MGMTIPMYLRTPVLMGVGLSGCRTIRPSDYRAVGLSGRRNIGRSPFPTAFIVPHHLPVCQQLHTDSPAQFDSIWTIGAWVVDIFLSMKTLNSRPNLLLFNGRINIYIGAAVAEWLSSWLAEQEDRGSIPSHAT